MGLWNRPQVLKKLDWQNLDLKIIKQLQLAFEIWTFRFWRLPNLFYSQTVPISDVRFGTYLRRKPNKLFGFWTPNHYFQDWTRNRLFWATKRLKSEPFFSDFRRLVYFWATKCLKSETISARKLRPKHLKLSVLKTKPFLVSFWRSSVQDKSSHC